MGDDLERLGGTAAQAVHLRHVTATDVCEQGADRHLRRRNGDIDRPALHQIGVGAAVDQRHHALAAHPFLASDAAMMLSSSSLVSARKRSISSIASCCSKSSSVASPRSTRPLPTSGLATTSARRRLPRSASPSHLLSEPAPRASRCCRHRRSSPAAPARPSVATHAMTATNVFVGGQQEDLVTVLDDRLAGRHDRTVAADRWRRSCRRLGRQVRRAFP